MRYYEQTTFFGHESDADIEVTPGMAMMIPGRPWTPPAYDGRTTLEEVAPIQLQGDPEPVTAAPASARPDRSSDDP
jgi:hypothetical protein